jgi:hypothetical protein
MNTPRCDAEITPIDGDTSYAATHCGRVEGHAPEKRSGLVEHQSYAALARKQKGVSTEEKEYDLQFSESAPNEYTSRNNAYVVVKVGKGVWKAYMDGRYQMTANSKAKAFKWAEHNAGKSNDHGFVYFGNVGPLE